MEAQWVLSDVGKAKGMFRLDIGFEKWGVGRSSGKDFMSRVPKIKIRI